MSNKPTQFRIIRQSQGGTLRKPPSSRGQHATVRWPSPACCLLLCGLELKWFSEPNVAILVLMLGNAAFEPQLSKMLTFPKGIPSFHEQTCTPQSILYYSYCIWNFVKQVFGEMCFLSW